jgi:hypothetical protein
MSSVFYYFFFFLLKLFKSARSNKVQRNLKWPWVY